jgi:hypothetical protein
MTYDLPPHGAALNSDAAHAAHGPTALAEGRQCRDCSESGCQCLHMRSLHARPGTRVGVAPGRFQRGAGPARRASAEPRRHHEARRRSGRMPPSQCPPSNPRIFLDASRMPVASRGNGRRTGHLSAGKRPMLRSTVTLALQTSPFKFEHVRRPPPGLINPRSEGPQQGHSSQACTTARNDLLLPQRGSAWPIPATHSSNLQSHRC